MVLVSTQSIQQIKIFIQEHRAFSELKYFGEFLEKTPLNKNQLNIFFATMWAFFKETPSGILSLALRVHDYWIDTYSWEAMAKSAYILSTAVDEFGLEKVHQGFLPTHHQLFRVTTSHFKLTSEDLLNESNILNAGKEIQKISYQFYRNEHLLKSLGFHLASELTSWHEFTCFLNGFLAHKKHYNIMSEQDEVMKFFLIHTLVEPFHLLNSEKILGEFLQNNSDAFNSMMEGAKVYMDAYFKLFNELTTQLKQSK